jgi:hypothetical protein
MKRAAASIVFTTLATSFSARGATIYTSQGAFLAALNPGSYLEDFQATNPPNYSGNGFSYSASAPGSTVYDSGSFIGANNANAPFVLDFSSGNVTAAGGEFFHTNVSDVFQPGISITITLSDGTVDTYTPAAQNEFRGYVSTGPALTSLTISAPTGGTFLTLDNVIVGSAIPEPGSAMLLAGVFGLALRRRRTV